MIEFSDDIKSLMAERFPNVDIYKMSLEELKAFREEVEDLRHEYTLIELAFKTLGNAGYGSCANPFFYFYNVHLAGDITGECRNLTKTMWKDLAEFFHETIWERKDLWEKFDFKLDESKHDWYREQPVSIYSDTDSIDKNSLLRLSYANGSKQMMTIEELFNYNLKTSGIFSNTESGHEIVEGNGVKVSNWNEKLKMLEYIPIRYIFRHKVSKPKFKIKTKSGKEIIVTGDHSCIVFRNGKKMVIKAKDINKETDRILSIYD